MPVLIMSISYVRTLVIAAAFSSSIGMADARAPDAAGCHYTPEMLQS